MTATFLAHVTSISARAALVAIEEMVPVFQPVVDLATGRVVGMEALARWPTVDGVDPAEVFELARLRGVVADIDFACRAAAVEVVRSMEAKDGRALYLNYEPSGIVDSARTDADLDALECGMDVVLEITERGLDAHPDRLEAMVGSARTRGFSIALDDVGADPTTLKALWIVRPNIVKLDASIVQRPWSFRSIRAMEAVRRYVAATGASLLAEGIETERHRRRAVRLGADLGQGWLFGTFVPGITQS